VIFLTFSIFLSNLVNNFQSKNHLGQKKVNKMIEKFRNELNIIQTVKYIFFADI